MISKVLIANRGAIAVRILRTLRRLGIASVAVYAEADRESLHVRRADEAHSLGEGAAATTYLDQDALLAIARRTGADAIHPGYGFLSENADFATRCEDDGIVFLGPEPEQILAFGLKHRARELAQESVVPLLPGTGLLVDPDAALAAAEQIGYPVMLKSTAGGGGIGMSRCEDATQLAAAFASVQRLSGANFGNSGVFLEKFITRARHIEVQVFGDGQGKVVALGTRDCSAQRRNQKVIEETPAPNLSAGVGEELAEVARRLAASVRYRSAGTVEFIYDSDTERFYFLEVNTRLQVEHGVTEQVYGVDLVEWMVRLGAETLPPLAELEAGLAPAGHSVQVRLYAEDPNKAFQPSTGLLTEVDFPPPSEGLRLDHWIEAGLEVTPLYDPMLAKVIATGETREAALATLTEALSQIRLYGVETNLAYLRHVLELPQFARGAITTGCLASVRPAFPTLDVLSAGTLTTVQDYPGRTGYWHVGVPPSGPFDNLAFRLGNRLLDNDAEAAGLEITLHGPVLRFNAATQVVLAGAETGAVLTRTDGARVPLSPWRVWDVGEGDRLETGAVAGHGCRAYLLLRGGLDCPRHLGSRATFTLGQLGGHGGRALRTGDVLHVHAAEPVPARRLAAEAIPEIGGRWRLRVIYGPHGAPDFLTDEDVARFFAARWEVHYNSSRTGVRLIGPKPDWARSDGGEAGLHPSNIHDNAYALGTVDFTGDMPVILGPDGPSLGGFVCPATVITADLWKLGQLKAGDEVVFEPVALADAVRAEREQRAAIEALAWRETPLAATAPEDCVIERIGDAVYRPQGDHYLLVEYGPLALDIALRFRVHALMRWLEQHPLPGLRELTPGVRSLQLHYDSQALALDELLAHLRGAEADLARGGERRVPARIVHLPLAWDDEACRLAIDKYMQSVRRDAPWCPSNIEFIRRINGLDSMDDVKRTVLDATYLVLGLGDVYLGAPVATPLDPRHRLVTTKYNPARTWTAENSVGIGGSYLCVYGMEGPGGYQFVGRTLQMWNRYRATREFSQPWLLRFFDQVRFFEVSAEELQRIRRDFPRGDYPLRIEETRFDLDDYQRSLQANRDAIEAFTARRERAFAAELQRWVESGQIHFTHEEALQDEAEAVDIPDGAATIESHVAGNIWQLRVQPGQSFEAGEPLLVIESMKMEIEVQAPHAGRVHRVLKQEGERVSSGQALIIVTRA